MSFQGALPALPYPPSRYKNGITAEKNIKWGMVQLNTSFQRLIQETAVRALQQSVAADNYRLRHEDGSSCPRILKCTGAKAAPQESADGSVTVETLWMEGKGQFVNEFVLDISLLAGAGIKAFIMKPIVKNDLPAVIRLVLGDTTP